MGWMFSGAFDFNQPLSSWDVSQVTDMAFMFYIAKSFDQPIAAWDVSRVTDFDSMFQDAWSFDQDLSGWCVPLIHVIPERFDKDARAWTLRRPKWGTCGPGPRDLTPPTGVYGSVSANLNRLTVSGTATDDRCLRAVAVGIRNISTGQWLRRDGTWGAFQKLRTELTSRDATTGRWHIERTLPNGRYGITLVVADTSGNKNPQPRPWRRITVY